MANRRALFRSTSGTDHTRNSAFSRRLAIALAILGLVVVVDLGLFGWWLFRSLSEREINQVLLETREEAKEIADQIADQAERQGDDLWSAVAIERQTNTFIGSVLRQREFERTVEVYDQDGTLVYLETTNGRSLPEGSPVIDFDETLEMGIAPRVETSESEFPFEVEEPIGELGTIRIGISREDLEQRVAVLRGTLVRPAATIAGVTVAILLGASAFIWILMRRGRKLEEQAVRAEHLAYVGTLASGLAHEIRSPLNSLNLNMQMLEEELDALPDEAMAPTGGRLLGITRHEIARLDRLVTDFLSYARPSPLDLESVPAVDLLREAVAVVESDAHARGGSVYVVDQSGGAKVSVDPSQIRQLLLNLINNALSAAEAAERKPKIRLEVDRHGAGVELRVIDNGIGIPAEEQAKVFDVFFSNRRGGTGLGLPIVRRIVENHEGQVGIESTEGEGTTIRVVLPLAERAGEREGTVKLRPSPTA